MAEASWSTAFPEFRLPKNIVKSGIGYVKSLGADLELDSVRWADRSRWRSCSKGAMTQYSWGIGAGAPRFLNVPGENLSGIYSANEYLTRVNLMKAYKFPEYDTPIKKGKKVAVVGGGNVAMDAARSAMRLGADEVHVVYRRSREEMPARMKRWRTPWRRGWSSTSSPIPPGS